MFPILPWLLTLGLAAALVVLIVSAFRKSEQRVIDEAARKRRASVTKDLVAAGIALDPEDAEALLELADATTVAALVELLGFGNRRVSRDAVEELGSLGPGAEEAIRAALDAEEDPDVLVDLKKALRISTGEDENPIVEVFR